MPAFLFDFDGVIADSEVLASAILAAELTALGVPTTLEESLVRYTGGRWKEILADIERGIGRPAPDDFAQRLKTATWTRFRAELKEVRGASAFVRRHAQVPHAIASSSSMERLRLCIDVLGIGADFPHVFSAEMVAHGKPHPDIYLLAAEKLGVAPRDCLVIEDSAGGVRAAIAAGMTAVGLTAASHIREGHDQRLREAGAHYLAASWDEVEQIAQRFLASRALQ